MSIKTIASTERLILRELTLDDAAFQLELMNTKEWHQFIGDREVYNLEDAKQYLTNGTLKSYQESGYGMWLMETKDDKRPVGLCGLVKREQLSDVEIGFALMPQETGKGYALEAAKATMSYAKHQHNLNKIIAITNPENSVSIKLLQALGLQFSKTLKFDELNEVLLFEELATNKSQKEQVAQIEIIIKSMLSKFNNKNGDAPDFEGLKALFIDTAVIISDHQGTPVCHDIDSFIEPRKELLTNGTFTEFSEQALSTQTQIYGNIAQCFALYQKSGLQHGEKYEGKGMKSVQLIKQKSNWKISSLIWSDEPSN